MAKTTLSDTIVIMDDEMYNMIWLIDYFHSLSYFVTPAASAEEAIEILSREIYRAAILDLNIPMNASISESAGKVSPVYQRYPGLFVARHARNSGYRDRQVIIYSVHRDPEVTLEATKLGCTYILKGRPAELKSELLSVLSYDPTD